MFSRSRIGGRDTGMHPLLPSLIFRPAQSTSPKLLVSVNGKPVSLLETRRKKFRDVDVALFCPHAPA